jgi:hypothetical protein
VRDLPPWAYFLVVWVFWFVAILCAEVGMLLLGALFLKGAG